MTNERGLSPELKVGIFVIIGCIILIYMSLKVGKFKLFGVKTYDVSVYFDNVEGLDEGGTVQISGVTVGRVKDISLQGNRAMVILEIGEDIVLKKDAIATIKTKGVLGEKFVELDPGESEETIPKKGGEIHRVKKTMELDKLIEHVDSVIGDIKEVSANLRKTMGGDEGERLLKGIFKNLYDLSNNLNNLVKKNDESLSNTVKNLEKFSDTLADKTPEIASELKEISKNLKEILAENRANLKEGLENFKTSSEKLDETLGSLKSVSEKIDKGQGTLGKLINEDSAHENLNKTLTGLNKMLSKAESIRTFFEFESEYLERLKDSRSQVNLKIYPKPDFFYMIGGVDTPYGSFSRRIETVTTSTGTTTSVTETERENRVQINAQIGKKFHNIEFRGGLFESTGGMALDYYSNNDKWKYSAEIYNFDRKYSPNLRLSAQYNLFKYLFLTGGVDDIISDRKRRSFFLGGGIKFEDEDIKYLLSSAPLPTK